MARDAPADTAGPSSPPPQLPEGWLAQWEGVQRKWYYVQRTTGKSQWEIPTEPVVLTPSTTPTSIGTGPSQVPPSRPSTNSPHVGQGNTLAERLGSLADRTRTSSSLDAQLNAQSPNPTDGSAEAGWHANQTGQRFPYDHRQQFAPSHGGYGTHHVQPQNPGLGPMGLYPNHLQHPMSQQAFGQPYPRTNWVGDGDSSQGRLGSFNSEHINNLYQGHAPGPVPFLQQSVHGAPAGHLPTLRSEQHPPEPQWQAPQQPVFSNSASQWPGSSNPSHLYFGSQIAAQAIEPSSSRMATQSSHFSNPSILNGDPNSNRTGLEPMHGSLNKHADGQGQSSVGYPSDGSHSQPVISSHQQGFPDPAAGAHAAQGRQSQPSSAHGLYHTSMVSAQSGPVFAPLGFPGVPDAHSNAHQYQNPLVQLGGPQYLHQQQPNHHGTAYHYRPRQSNVLASSRTSSSDPQFVSGPWASSTPPSTGAGQSSQQG